MKRMRFLSSAATLLAIMATAIAADPALTIYNDNFAVVRDTVKLGLRSGANVVRYPNTTAQVEPDSVILRDPTGKFPIQILEQNFRGDPVTQELLLSLYEGQTIEFLVNHGDRPTESIMGKVIRSGYVPGAATPLNGYDRGQAASSQPIIEVNGKLRFSLPGEPIFPVVTNDVVFKPTLSWLIQSDKVGSFDAELSYVTGGMSWEAAYNVVAPEQGDTLDIVGWVTINNQSGKTFDRATIKLMAGDVNKVQSPGSRRMPMSRLASTVSDMSEPPVSEKTFDEYHLYTLQRQSTLRDKEMKQVEFIRAAGVASRRLYIYDGAQVQPQYYGYPAEAIRQNTEYGTQSNPKVTVIREFYNSATNNLGIALPKGKVRFYRRDTNGSMEFTGENIIDHTPRDERVRMVTGNAFDIVGERKRTKIGVDNDRRMMDEAFEIEVRNRKKEPVEVRVVEHLYRSASWEITSKSDSFTKTESQTIEFVIALKANEERKVSYSVHYTW